MISTCFILTIALFFLVLITFSGHNETFKSSSKSSKSTSSSSSSSSSTSVYNNYYTTPYSSSFVRVYDTPYMITTPYVYTETNAIVFVIFVMLLVGLLVYYLH